MIDILPSGLSGGLFMLATRTDITELTTESQERIYSLLASAFVIFRLSWTEGKLDPALQIFTPNQRRGEILARERPSHILQTTALINEAYIRLIDWQN